jgi:hypothetical protein
MVNLKRNLVKDLPHFFAKSYYLLLNRVTSIPKKNPARLLTTCYGIGASSVGNVNHYLQSCQAQYHGKRAIE